MKYYKLGIIEVEGDQNSCLVMSNDAFVGMSSPDHIFYGDATIVRVGACKDIVISVATSMLVKPSNEE